MKNHFIRGVALGTLVALCGCVAPRRPAPGTAPPDPLLMDTTNLYEICRHLYRWYLDEGDIEKSATARTFSFWIRALHPELDEQDHSRFGEIILPALGIVVTLKKADYTIEEYGAQVKSDTYKIVNVARLPSARTRPAGYTVVSIDHAALRAYLFKTRADAIFPDETLARRMARAVKSKLEAEGHLRPAASVPPEEIIHIAPLSPVANETWVFWETGGLLIHFAADIDWAQSALDAHSDLAVRLYDVKTGVVVSLDEVAGSNAYLTRDQVGRALFNCIVLGKRITLAAPPLRR